MFQASAPEELEGLGEYALGKTGDIHPEGTGRLMKAGTKLRWNMHYSANPNREDTYDRTSIAFWFYPASYVPKHKLTRQSVGSVTDLDFPPGETNVRTDGYTVIENNIRLTVYQPHLHNLGKRQCLEAIYRDGRVQTLNCVNWDFGWHIAYNYTDVSQPLLHRLRQGTHVPGIAPGARLERVEAAAPIGVEPIAQRLGGNAPARAAGDLVLAIGFLA